MRACAISFRDLSNLPAHCEIDTVRGRKSTQQLNSGSSKCEVKPSHSGPIQPLVVSPLASPINGNPAKLLQEGTPSLDLDVEFSLFNNVMSEDTGDQQIRPEEKEHQKIYQSPSSIFTLPSAGTAYTASKSVADAMNLLLLDRKRCHALLDCQAEYDLLCEGDHRDTEATKRKRKKK